MIPLAAATRSNRVAFLFLFLTLLIAGIEVWAIRATLGFLLR